MMQMVNIARCKAHPKLSRTGGRYTVGVLPNDKTDKKPGTC